MLCPSIPYIMQTRKPMRMLLCLPIDMRLYLCMNLCTDHTLNHLICGSRAGHRYRFGMCAKPLTSRNWHVAAEFAVEILSQRASIRIRPHQEHHCDDSEGRRYLAPFVGALVRARVYTVGLSCRRISQLRCICRCRGQTMAEHRTDRLYMRCWSGWWR